MCFCKTKPQKENLRDFRISKEHSLSSQLQKEVLEILESPNSVLLQK
ncbi:hypothetical protein [Helicobacter enhydrae]|nr:hypothetical protein [Helicobacter enhydrae]